MASLAAALPAASLQQESMTPAVAPFYVLLSVLDANVAPVVL